MDGWTDGWTDTWFLFFRYGDSEERTEIFHVRMLCRCRTSHLSSLCDRVRSKTSHDADPNYLLFFFFSKTFCSHFLPHHQNEYIYNRQKRIQDPVFLSFFSFLPCLSMMPCFKRMCLKNIYFSSTELGCSLPISLYSRVGSSRLMSRRVVYRELFFFRTQSTLNPYSLACSFAICKKQRRATLPTRRSERKKGKKMNRESFKIGSTVSIWKTYKKKHLIFLNHSAIKHCFIFYLLLILSLSLSLISLFFAHQWWISSSCCFSNLSVTAVFLSTRLASRPSVWNSALPWYAAVKTNAERSKKKN